MYDCEKGANDMNTQHTPGPWKTWPSIHNGQTYIVKGDYTSKDNGCIAHADTEANARLIAAAPDLLEALEFIAKQSMSMYGSYAYMIEKLQDTARAAIAKATNA
jgi:hypothetical protein